MRLLCIGAPLLFLGLPRCPLLIERALAFEQIMLQGHDLSLQLLSLHRGGRLQGLNLLRSVLAELIFTLLRLVALCFEALLKSKQLLALLIFARLVCLLNIGEVLLFLGLPCR